MQKGIDYVGVGIGAVIVNKDNKLFLSKRGKQARNEQGLWEFPGGGLKFGDSFENTIKREIKEEFGMEIEIKDSLEAFNHLIPQEKQHWVALCFVCNHVSGTPQILEPDKCEQIGWFSYQEAREFNLTLTAKHRVKQLSQKYPELCMK
ncbi:hypothetical protein A2313_01505 [Candidatus Roizmanbacteria bacterium RIFOXYB2_FULL_41_10]|nr:MAG: hypothetical protein A2262_02605 [Candidatus Roizmanbacteria bacterium RIFOXYA2_FULL_41_8]OGK71045.1 MAG: hypothetical protein A2313_01505 [Candidatus Roizmanbacteria bacterium RIFOXYB2_FULL_41_10]OGK72932.1 MAG: hypothetical protein A2459_00225 [Candidatus Roizmanbacteria bacterium RIFOXYC2_FULL_41_10]OGK74987.1 MAG: hypothetical protein A2575_03625 [Candidatus Roizmanbacteria bacterium RIFOXYD1_FULL_41_24]